MNSYEVYIKVSDWVASVATGICVQYCNESNKSASVFNEAVKVMNVIRQLEMSDQVRDYFIKNMRILSSNAYAASEAERRASSGCYIATMVYGSYDSPEVMILRNYRDQKLNQHLFGRIFIKTYYFVSPSFVSLTKDIPFVHKPIRYLLTKL